MIAITLAHRTKRMKKMTPRDEKGRAIKVNCDDINCSGRLVYDIAASERFRQHVWHCDGLTHEGDCGELRACDRTIYGPHLRAARAM